MDRLPALRSRAPLARAVALTLGLGVAARPRLRRHPEHRRAAEPRHRCGRSAGGRSCGRVLRGRPGCRGGPPLGLPALAAGSLEPSHVRRWVNVWATWCRPCVEEMPMLVEWKDRLRGDGIDVELLFVSADETDDDVAGFRREHPTVPESLRVADRIDDSASGRLRSVWTQARRCPSICSSTRTARSAARGPARCAPTTTTS